MPRRFLSAVFIFAFVAPAASDDPMKVTSDTPDYCLGLAQRLDGRANMLPEARSLSVEGRRMCQSGHVHAGLARVRRAMLMERGEAR